MNQSQVDQYQEWRQRLRDPLKDTRENPDTIRCWRHACKRSETTEDMVKLALASVTAPWVTRSQRIPLARHLAALAMQKSTSFADMALIAEACRFIGRRHDVIINRAVVYQGG